MYYTLTREDKILLVKTKYEYLTNQIYLLQCHIYRCTKELIISSNNRIKILKLINDAISTLNTSYCDTINELIINNEISIHINDNSNIVLSNEYLVNIIKYEKVFNYEWISKLFIHFTKIEEKILIICKDYGFFSIHQALEILLDQNYLSLICDELKNKIHFLNKVFIPLNYIVEPILNTNQTNTPSEELSTHNSIIHQIIILQNEKSNAIFIDNYANVNIITNNTINKIAGYFINDHLNLITKTSKLIYPEIYNCKNALEQSLINDVTEYVDSTKSKLNLCDIDLKNKNNFYKSQIKSLPYYYYLIYSQKEIIQKLHDNNNLYNQLISEDFQESVAKFKTCTLTEMFNIIKILLLKSDCNLANILYKSLRTKKNNNPFLCQIIYNNLNFSLQTKLKKTDKLLQVEWEKLKTHISDNPYEKQLLLSNMPDYAKQAAMEKIEEIGMSNGDNYKQVLYVKTLLKYPWPKDSDFDQFKEFNINKEKGKEFIQTAKDLLNERVYGHQECKNTIQELICKWISNPKCYGGAIGLAGPPGVGKTLLCKALGIVLNIPFVQITLGGQNDGDILHGHGYTYSSAQPGLIVKKMMEAGSSRCIMYFDELDKAGSKHGSNEIYNILIHLIDPNTNTHFQDRFFQEVTFPLNNVIFVFSYNDSSLIDPILYDRITEIDVKPYTVADKINISKNYLIKEICTNIGFDLDLIRFNDNVLEYIIENYTSEAGVRDLHRNLEKIILRLNVDKLYDRGVFLLSKKIKINKELVNSILDEPNILIRKIHSIDTIGIVNGLYATTHGSGGLIPIQIYNNCKGTDRKFAIKITGNHGKVMRESVSYSFTTAMHLLNANKQEIFIKANPRGLHLHTPNAATKKDGPSAGCAITVAFISKILSKSIKNNIAITGEIEPTGKITAIGGLTYKLYGAKKAGIKVVYIPKENEKDFNKIQKECSNLINDNFKVRTVDHIIEILKEVLNDFDINDYNRTIKYHALLH